MDRQEISEWNAARWETEFNNLMEIARKHLRPEWKSGEVLVLKTGNDNIVAVEIPDFQDPTIREPLENQCIRSLVERDDTDVLLCVATMGGEHPEIPSWNFRSGLVAANPDNLQTYTFLWGGGEVYHVKQFKNLLPPEKK